MGMFGGASQRAAAAMANPRNVGGDGLALTEPRRGMFARKPVPSTSDSALLVNPAAGAASWSVPFDGSPMPVAGVALTERAPEKPGFFGKNGGWRDVVGAIGDALSGNPIYFKAKTLQEEAAREEAWRKQQRTWQIEDRNWKASQPEYFMSGRDRVRYNPMTGETDVVYDGTEDFEQYAATMGLSPGSDEYFTAVQDYVLRGNGPSALGFDMELDDHRTANDKGLDDYRTHNRIRVRGVPTWRDKNPPAPRSRSVPKRPRATNAKGQAVEWNGKAWVAAK